MEHYVNMEKTEGKFLAKCFKESNNIGNRKGVNRRKGITSKNEETA